MAVPAGGDRVGRQGLAGGVDSRAADELFVEVKTVTVPVGDTLQYAAPGSGYLGTDAVTRQQRNQGFQGRCSS